MAPRVPLPAPPFLRLSIVPCPCAPPMCARPSCTHVTLHAYPSRARMCICSRTWTCRSWAKAASSRRLPGCPQARCSWEPPAANSWCVPQALLLSRTAGHAVHAACDGVGQGPRHTRWAPRRLLHVCVFACGVVPAGGSLRQFEGAPGLGAGRHASVPWSSCAESCMGTGELACWRPHFLRGCMGYLCM